MRKLKRILDELLFNVLINLRSFIRADVKRCPECGTLNYASEYRVEFFGWTFKTKCRKCGHIYDWMDAVL